MQFVKSLGAEMAFDYNDPECSNKIKELTDDKLHLVLDCISEGSSPEICTAAVSSAGGKVAYLLPVEHTREGIENFVSFSITPRRFRRFADSSRASSLIPQLVSASASSGKILLRSQRTTRSRSSSTKWPRSSLLKGS